ncbi:MAG: hypothetical protein C4519_14845 [Desulfobacteraceae bacterium]|nr:MAG: hypothetical protein C4519_14845 [Desulfobacteraceae bacterium]
MANMLLKAALWYRRNGFSVHPVGAGPDQKRPLLKTWKPYMTTPATEEQIIEWWRRWPNASIGVIAGKVSELTVVDPDTAVGMKMVDEFLPESFVGPISRTPKGKHYWFAHTEGLKSTVRAIEGCDIRTDGAYILAPPSRRNEGCYRFLSGLGIHEVALPTMPEKLRQALMDSQKGEVEPKGAAKACSPGLYGATALARELAQLAATPIHLRNNQLNKSAYSLGRLVGGGELDRTQVETSLFAVAIGIGLELREIKATIASGIVAGMNKPRTGNHVENGDPQNNAASSTRKRKAALAFI